MISKRHRGFTLIELMVSLALFSLISLAAYQGVLTLIKGQNRAVTQASIRMVAETVLAEVRRRVGNTIIIDPPEGLLVPTDNLYRGIAGVPTTTTIAGCAQQAVDASNEKFSVVRFTSFEYKVGPETLLGQWSESEIGTPKRLHLTTHPEDNVPQFVFQGPGFTAPELYIIDADKLSLRRYRVAVTGPSSAPLSPYDIVEQVNTDVDPNDGVSKPGNSYTYHQVSLQMPLALNGMAQVPQVHNNITGSFAYPVRTFLLCASPEGKIILKEEVTGEERVLMDPTPFNVNLTKLEFRYYGTPPTAAAPERLEFSRFHLFPFSDLNKVSCINNFMIDMEFTAVTGNAKLEQFREIIPLQTFNTRRPGACL